jgi:type III secretion system YscQ/HrcQ family protein
MTARPFPYADLSRVGAADAGLLRAALRALRVADARATAEAEALLGVRAALVPGAAELLSSEAACSALGAAPCGPWLEHAAGARSVALVCELAPELAAALVDRVLGGDGRTAHAAGQPLDDVSCGALAYLAACACAASAAPLRVHAPRITPGEARALFAGARVLVWPLALALAGQHAGRLRVFIPESGARELALHARPAPRNALRELLVTLCAHAACVMLSRREAAALAVGDIVVPDRCGLTRNGGAYAGTIELHAVGSRHVQFRAHARARELVIESASAGGDSTMSEGKRIEPRSAEPGRSALGDDVPIELCLEIARFTLPLGELAALAPGEVLSTGSAIGEHVALSIAGRVIARGELVEVDGEVGMRVLELVRA